MFYTNTHIHYAYYPITCLSLHLSLYHQSSFINKNVYIIWLVSILLHVCKNFFALITGHWGLQVFFLTQYCDEPLHKNTHLCALTQSIPQKILPKYYVRVWNFSRFLIHIAHLSLGTLELIHTFCYLLRMFFFHIHEILFNLHT